MPYIYQILPPYGVRGIFLPLYILRLYKYRKFTARGYLENSSSTKQQKSALNSSGIEHKTHNYGLDQDLNPGPIAPKARIIPLDQRVDDF